YHWPGNIRELGTVIDRAAILGDGKSLEVSKALGVMPSHARPSLIATSRSTAVPPSSPTIVSLEEALREHITLALHATQGRIEGPKGAAKLLKINPHTLRAKMRKLNLDWTHFRK
ncbi:MAG TPA: hypothetical protein VK137_12590, partial [Planctomycetaceae bacterium]|nr:hypothetical protein [Planctomycetaceae bacterium]